MSTVYLGLGANLGNREANLRMALRAMTRMARVHAVSSLYESEPEGGAAQPAYYNAVCRIETGLEPLPLLLHGGAPVPVLDQGCQVAARRRHSLGLRHPPDQPFLFHPDRFDLPTVLKLAETLLDGFADRLRFAVRLDQEGGAAVPDPESALNRLRRALDQADRVFDRLDRI